MRKKVIITVLILFLLGLAAGVYYFNRFILPTIVKEKITTGLSELTGGKVTMGKVSFNLLRGIVVSDLTLFEKDNPGQKLFSVKEASANFVILSYLISKKLTISSIELKSFNFNLARRKDNTLNVSYLFDKFKRPAGQKQSQFSLFIRKMKISDSTLIFKDDSFDTPVSIILTIVDSEAKLSWNKVVFQALAQISKDGKNTDLTIKGNYALANKGINGNLLAKNLDLKTYEGYLKNIPVELLEAKIPQVKANFSLDDKEAKVDSELLLEPLSLKYKDYSLKSSGLTTVLRLQAPKPDLENVSYQGKVLLENSNFSSQENYEIQAALEKASCDFSGDKDAVNVTLSLAIADLKAKKDNLAFSKIKADANIEAKIPLKEKTDLTPVYEGSIQLKDGQVSGIKSIDKITDITSNLKFKNTGASFENIECSINDASVKVMDTAVTIEGGLKDKLLNAKLSGNFDLTGLPSVIPKNVKLPAYEVSGIAKLSVNLSSDITSLVAETTSGAMALNASAALEQINIRLPDKDLNLAIGSGLLEFDALKESLKWSLQSVRFQDMAFQLDGQLKNFKAPSISAKITGDDIKVEAQATKQNNQFNISKLKAEVKNSEINISGKVDTQGDLNLTGNLLLNLADAKDFLGEGKMKEALEKSGLSGKLSADTEVQGPAKNWRLWNIKSNATSKIINYYGLKFQDVNLTYRQLDMNGFIDSFSFDAYRGRGTVSGRINLLNEAFSYNLQGSLKDVDLNQLKLDTPWKDKTFFGTFSTTLLVSGIGKDLKNMTGEGNLSIKNGNIWEFNPLKGLGNFLFIPRFTNINFSQAYGDLTIKNGYVSTDNLELVGTELGLIIEGTISFAGELNLLVNTEVLKPGLTKAAGPAGKVSDVINTAGNFSAIKITGTVKNPKYKLQPIGENIMKKLRNVVSDILPGVGELF